MDIDMDAPTMERPIWVVNLNGWWKPFEENENKVFEGAIAQGHDTIEYYWPYYRDGKETYEKYVIDMKEMTQTNVTKSPPVMHKVMRITSSGSPFQ